MKPLSPTLSKTLDEIRQATAIAPFLRFELDPEPAETALGWRVGARPDGTALVVTPTRRAMMIEGGARTRFYDWARRELEEASAAAEKLSDEEALALVGAPATADELVARLGGTEQSLSDEELLDLLGANDSVDIDLDDSPALDDWLPEGVSAEEIRGWTMVGADEVGAFFRAGDGFAIISHGGVERLTLREAAVGMLARPHCVSIAQRSASLARAMPEPATIVGAIGVIAIASPFIALGSLVAGIAIAAVIAVAGLILSEVGVGIPDPPSIEWLIGAPSTLVFMIVAVAIARAAHD